MRLIFLGIVFLTQNIFSQTLHVYDAWSLRAVPNCSIIVQSDTLYTDEKGLCEIVLKTGKEYILIEKENYFAAQIANTDNKNFSVYLQPVENSEVITVRPTTANQPIFLPTSMSQVSLNAKTKARYISIDQVLKTESGITFKSYGGDGQIKNIALRGMTGEQTQVLFDGIPLNSLQLGLADFGGIGTSNISTINIYKGGSSLFGGNGAIGGTINLKPQQITEQTEFRVSQSGSTIRNYKTGLFINIPIGTLKQSFHADFNSGKNSYSTKNNGEELTLKNRDYKSRNLFWQGDYKFSEFSTVNILLSNFTYKGGSPNPFVNKIAELGNVARRTNNNSLMRLKFSHKFSQGSLSAQAYRRNEWNSYKSPATNSLHFNKETGLQLKGKFLVSDQLLIRTGIEAAIPAIKSSEAGEQDKERFAVYLVNDFFAYNDLENLLNISFNLSTRLEKNGKHLTFLPGAGITVGFDKLSWFASVAKNFRAPSFNELYWPVYGNINLESEKSLSFESGLSYKNNYSFGSFNSSVVFYRSVVKNQIKWLPILKNISEVTTYGIELGNKVGLFKDAIFIHANYTLSNPTKTKAEFEGDANVGNRISFIPQHKLSLNAFYTYSNFSAGYDLDFQSFRFQTLANDNNDILPSFVLMSAWVGASIKLPYNLETDIYLFAENITDCEYQLYGGYPMPPRHYKLNLSIKY